MQKKVTCFISVTMCRSATPTAAPNHALVRGSLRRHILRVMACANKITPLFILPCVAPLCDNLALVLIASNIVSVDGNGPLFFTGSKTT